MFKNIFCFLLHGRSYNRQQEYLKIEEDIEKTKRAFEEASHKFCKGEISFGEWWKSAFAYKDSIDKLSRFHNLDEEIPSYSKNVLTTFGQKVIENEENGGSDDVIPVPPCPKGQAKTKRSFLFWMFSH